MLVYEIVLSRRADKALRMMPRQWPLRVVAALRAIAADPCARHAKVTAFKGVKGGFRFRAGDYRALYVVDTGKRRMHVVRLSKRDEAYR